jgi:hypothetical protein
VFSGVSNAHPTFNNTTISLSLKTNITILKEPHIILPRISLALNPEQLYHPQTNISSSSINIMGSCNRIGQIPASGHIPHIWQDG